MQAQAASFHASLQEEMPHLNRYARSLASGTATEADDLVQVCLERALRYRHQFRPGTDLRCWLFTIMRNAHIDEQRKVTRRGRHIPLEDWHDESHRPANQERYVELQEVQQRLSRLRPCDRQVVRMSVIAGLPHEIIAKRLDVAVGTVKSRLSRARRAIAEAPA